MKKQLLMITGLACFATMAFAGGIVTNSNQSAAWVRTLNRDASTGIDAVYFNPAGLTKLNDGFHVSLNNQFIIQTKDVTSDYSLLSPTPKKFTGEINVPLFPSIYAAWKKNKVAVSFGFNPIGGGGGAEYSTGLPSLENQISGLVPSLRSQLTGLNTLLTAGYGGFNPQLNNITDYRADIYFKGSSVFLGYQLGVTYQITDVISAFIGGRLVTANNVYEGSIRDIQIYAAPATPPILLYDIPAGWYVPGDYLTKVSQATGVPAGALDAAISAVNAATADKEVDAEESGKGFAPILGIHIATEKLNLGIKYEFKTKLDLTQTVNDGKGMKGLFVQDSTVHSDMPAMLSIGADYQLTSKLSVLAGFHMYFDKSANYGKTLDDAPTVAVKNKELIDNNYFEISAGLEYDITDKLLVSGGYLLAKTGVSEDYQSDISYSLTSNSGALGLGYKISEKLMVNLGASYSIYNKGEKAMPDNILHDPAGYTYTLEKNTLIIGIGIDYTF
jgi:long-subunit fatty acid transport protein